MFLEPVLGMSASAAIIKLVSNLYPFALEAHNTREAWGIPLIVLQDFAAATRQQPVLVRRPRDRLDSGGVLVEAEHGARRVRRPDVQLVVVAARRELLPVAGREGSAREFEGESLGGGVRDSLRSARLQLQIGRAHV